MEEHLEEYIKKHMQEGRANILHLNDVFYVPAVIYCIESQ